MIGVIADDLTGAAELGAVGLRYGLRAEILLAGPIQPEWEARPPRAQFDAPRVEPSAERFQRIEERERTEAFLADEASARTREGARAPHLRLHRSDVTDLVCVDSDSRSCSAQEAAHRAAAATRSLLNAGASWIYKKVDSVLRGHVAVELEAIMQTLGLQRALLIPANPSLGRTIQAGRYFIRGVPLHETEFANDPEYPRTFSKVIDCLEPPDGFSIHSCGVTDALLDSGIVVGDAASEGDLLAWTARREAGTLMAGGSGFFGALLAAQGHRASKTPVATSLPTGTRELFVCGTSSLSARDLVNAANASGTPVFSLPAKLATGAPLVRSDMETIASNVTAAFNSHRRIVLNVGLPLVTEPAIARELAIQLVEVADRVLQQIEIGHVYVEGGATAAALLKRMGWNRLTVCQELAPGVATLAVEGRQSNLLTVKPGSYAWPRELLNTA